MSIFISYRRGDAAGHAQNLHHRLCGWFDAKSELFFDVDAIGPGEPFPKRLADAIDAASVVLVLIGPGWLDEINRRAANPGDVDFVRREIELALQRSARGEALRIIPVLLAGNGMFSSSELAEPLRATLAPLCAIDAYVFGTGKQDDWEYQFVRFRALIAAAPGAPRERFRDRAGAPQPWKVIEHLLSPCFQDPNELVPALRAQLLGASSSAVARRGGAKVVVLQGMGGIGKTQLALAYCLDYRGAYSGVWWFRAESACGQGDSLLQQDARAACAAAGAVVPTGASPSQVFRQWLEGQQAPWLLVFDNADDSDALRRHLPQSGVHHVLITSRRPDWGGMAGVLELQVWTAQQGGEFLLQRLQESAQRSHGEELARELGGLPLALEQAAGYVETTRGTVEEYLALWREAATALLDENVVNSGYEYTVAVSLSLAFGRLSPSARQLLCLCSFAAPEPLPERFFLDNPAALPGALQSAASQRLTWNRVTAELQGYALVQRVGIATLERPWLAGGQVLAGTPKEFAMNMHRLTQQVVRNRLAELPDHAVYMLNILAQACPDNGLESVHWPRLGALLPHAIWLNEAPSVTSLKDVAHVRSRTRLLEHAVAYLHFGLALSWEASVWLEKVLTVRSNVLGEEHAETLVSKGNLAELLRALGDSTGARRLQEETLTARSDKLGEEDPETLISMGCLAETLRARGDLDGARELHEKALAIWRRTAGDAHPDTLVSMSNLASTLRAQGDLAAARILQEHVLAVRRKVAGEEHPSTVISMGNMATILLAQGDLTGARDLQEEVLKISRRVLGEEHPQTTISMGNLASTLDALGNLDGARGLEEKVLAVHKRVLGAVHPHTLTSMSNLAMTLWRQYEYESAISLMTEATQGAVKVYGAEDMTARRLAEVLAEMRRASDS